MTDEIPEIPDEIASMMRDDEIENMRNLDGWAVGTVVLVGDETSRRIEDAWIELFNGEGRAGEFGGTRFMAIDDGEYEEAYAYGSKEAMGDRDIGWYVESYDYIDGDVGEESP